MIEVAAFGGGLAIAAVAARRHGGKSMRWAAMTLTLAWLAVLVSVAFAGVNDPWLLFIVIDSVAAFVVLSHRDARCFPETWIGAIFMAQIVCHVVYGFSFGPGPATGLYLNMLAAGGWCQIVVLISGAIYGTGTKIHHSGGRGGGTGRALEIDRSHIETRG